MTDIYEQFDKATRQVTAYAITRGEEYVGRIVFRAPADGAGRLWCYAQIWGAPMARSFAVGYGYDKGSAAAEAAVAKLPEPDAGREGAVAHWKAWRAALSPQSCGERWARRLEQAGYNVLGVC